MHILLILSVLVSLALGRTYPMYKQCDSSWKNDALGSSSTICAVGCLMSSMAMALKGLGVKVPVGQTASPKTLNSWLNSNSGYSGNLFIWSSVHSFSSLRYEGKITNKEDIKSRLNKNDVVILNVRSGGHWVLATGAGSDYFTVNDPGYSVSSYKFTEVTQAAIYKASSYSSYSSELYWIIPTVSVGGVSLCCLIVIILVIICGVTSFFGIGGSSASAASASAKKKGNEMDMMVQDHRDPVETIEKI